MPSLNKIIFSFLFVFPAICGYTQLPNNLGKGLVTIDQFFLSSDHSNTDTIPVFCRYTYYVNDSVVLRKDSSSRSWMASNKDTGQIHLTLELQHFSYLIDWKNKTLFIAYKKGDTPLVAKNELASFSYEFLFRFPLIRKVHERFLYSDMSDSQTIWGYHAVAGYALYDSSKIKFYYTLDSTPLYSPLNFFLPNFAHPILSIRLPTSDSLNPICQFTVKNISSKEVDKDAFELPAGSNIKSNVPVAEIINSLQKSN